MLGQTVGQYQITAKLGEGGMGAVYRAKHSMLGREVAVKVLLAEYSNNENVVKRFFNEAKAATAIQHPGIVEIFDFGHTADGSAYIIMELLQGEPLNNRLHRERKMPLNIATGIMTQVASGLGAAHNAGIIHRDLKPDNVFLVPDELVDIGVRAKLLDFGIAKLSEDLRGELEATRAGAVLGTPPYMAPEQCVGSTAVDHRSDIYALGCLLFQLLTGRTPFVSEEFATISIMHLRDPVPSLRELEPSVTPELEQIVFKMLAKKPEDRFQDCAQLVAALTGKPIPAPAPMPQMSAAPNAPTLDSDSGPMAAAAGGAAPAPARKTAVLRAPDKPPMTPTPSPGFTPTPGPQFSPTPAPASVLQAMNAAAANQGAVPTPGPGQVSSTPTPGQFTPTPRPVDLVAPRTDEPELDIPEIEDDLGIAKFLLPAAAVVAVGLVVTFLLLL